MIVELERSCPAPSPKRKPVGVVEPVPPLATVRVPVVSEIAIARDEVFQIGDGDVFEIGDGGA